MANVLEGKRVAFLFTEGVEQVELTEPLEAGGATAGVVGIVAAVGVVGVRRAAAPAPSIRAIFSALVRAAPARKAVRYGR